MNALQQVDPLKVISAELYRSYILAGRKKDAPDISDLSEQAGAIIEMNAREPRPVPAAVWGDLFQYARRKWSLCGFGELMRAWEGEEFTLWQAERRRAAAAAAPRQEQPKQEEVSEQGWVDIWGEAWQAGQWVPSFMAAELEAKFGKQKIFAENLDNRETAE